MLKNKKVLILGASSFIGKDISAKCTKEGAELFLTYNTQKPDFESSNLYQLDVTDNKSIETFLDSLSTLTFDIVISCIGSNIGGPLISLEQADIEKQMQVNLGANIQIIQSVLKNMIRKRNGSIILMSSVSAHRFTRGHSIYSAAKSGLEGFSRAMAAELAKRNIRVNTISPGPVMSPMLEQSIKENGDDPKLRVPMNRLIDASEVADAALFLASDMSSAITGVNLPVDGGYVLW